MKKLLFSIALVTLTACGGGGGGGGGGSSAPPEINIPPVPEINIPDISNPDGGYGTPKPIDKDGTINIKDIGNNGNISGKKVVGIFAENKNIILDKNISVTDEASEKNGEERNLNGYSFGAFLKGGAFTNSGTINLAGDKITGIFAENTKIINNGNIVSSDNTQNVIGIFSQNNNKTSAINNGKINLYGSSQAVGMYLHNSIGINDNEIIVSSPNKAVGMYAEGKNAGAVNNKKITVKGSGCGIAAGYGAKGSNLKEINIEGKGYGMYAFSGGKVLNDISGTINLSDKALGGMVADGKGSVAENRGTINIDKDSHIKNGDEIKAINGGTIINRGIINKDGDLFVNVSEGKYIVGTEKNGSYGKITGNKINFNGDIQINSDITKVGYKNEYVLENILKADEITFEKESSVTTDSILYDGKISEKEDGSISGILIRNGKNLTDFADKKVLQTAKVFEKYYNEENYNSLGEKEKNLLNEIKLNSSKNLNESLKDLTPSIYGNISRQIIDIGKNFRAVQRENIYSLKNKKYGFSLIENFSDIETGDYIEGYEYFMTGFLGSIKFDKNIYLSFGYGYSDIDYDNNNSGDIHTLYLGMDKIFKNNNLIFEFGFDGQYNFHDNERELKSFSEESDSDFNSYGAEIYSRVSKEYTNYLDFIPFAQINLGYYKFDSFSEKVADNEIKINSDDFVTVNSSIGMEVRKEINNFKIYSEGVYSYEFGNIDRKLGYTYENISEKVVLKDEQEDGFLSLKAGINYRGEKILTDINGEKTFGERDEWSIKFKATYIF